MKKKLILCTCLLLIAVVSCKKETPLHVDLTKELENQPQSDLDQWLKASFLEPYNMAFIYKFNRYYADLDKEVAPVKEEKVRPVAEAVKKIFIDTYVDVAGKKFFNPIAPKQFALYGSAEYSDQQRKLGSADAGRQINLYVLNSFDQKAPATFMQMFHTIHHEFGHIMHQNIPVPPLFESISNSYVGSNWVGSANSAAVAKSLGFITRYARMNKDEDFVETISTLLIEGQDYYDAYANTAEQTAKKRLRDKEAMVVDYYKGSFGIDFRVLQEKVKSALEAYSPSAIPTPLTNFNRGSYINFLVDKNAVYQSEGLVKAMNAASQGRFPLDGKFELTFADLESNRTDMILKLTGGIYKFWYNLKATVTNNGIKLSARPQGPETEYGNGDFIADQTKPLLDYLTTKNLSPSSIEKLIPGSKDALLGFMDDRGQLVFYGSVARR